MWIDSDGNLYGNGRCRSTDRPASAAEVRALHAALGAAVTSFADLPKHEKALLLASAAMAGKTPAEAEAAFATALAAL